MKYEDVLTISKFAGINQANDGHNVDFRFAVAGMNFDTTHGGFKPYKSSKVIPISFEEGVDNILNSPPCRAQYRDDKEITIAMLNKRWKQGVSGIIPTDKTVYAVMIAAGKIWYRKNDLGTFYNCEWKELKNGSDSFAFADSKFDYVTYEINFGEAEKLTNDILTAVKNGEKQADIFDSDDGKYYTILIDSDGKGYYENFQGKKVTLTVGTSMVRVGYDAPVDCLLITNTTDGMYCIYAPLDSEELMIRRVPVKPLGVEKEIKFGCLARHAERIFGGGIDSDPDKVMYSATYDPFNWEQDNVEPDDGVGDIQQSNWDGDGFVALRDFGNQLLLIKKHAVWRLTGTTPSEFVMRKQYGEGTIAENSVVVIGANAYMFTDTDILVYDGASTRPVRKDIMKDNFPMPVNAEQVFACAYDGNYLFSFLPRGNDDMFGSGTQCIGILNTSEGTLSIATSTSLIGMVAHDTDLYLVETQYHADSPSEDKQHAVLCEAFKGTPLRVEWLSAWQDMEAKNVVKSGFEVYVTMHTDNPNDGGVPNAIPVEIEIESEKKVKCKQVQLTPMKTKRIRINNKGRMFRMRIVVPATDIDWQLATGMQIKLEYDAD